MEYVYGTKGDVEILKTKGDTHTDLSGYQQTERVYENQVVVDSFRVVKKLESQEDGEGNCYDWYEIDHHYRYEDKYTPAAEELRRMNETAAIAFVTLAESGTIDDVTAGEHPEVFAAWEPDAAYTVGNIRRYGDKLYRCVQAHTSQSDWAPDKTPALWACTADPAEEWPAWSQPLGAHDAYGQGAKVSHKGKHWISTTPNNVWEPGVYGWEEAE